MLAIPSSVIAAVSGVFTFIGFGVVVCLFIYAIYRYFQYRNRPPASEFVDIENQRQQNIQELRDYTVGTTNELQHQAEQILTGIQNGQEHLKTLIVELDRGVQDIQSNQVELKTTTEELQGTVINPFQTLLDNVKLGFQSLSTQINQLISIYTQVNKSLFDREKELANILDNLKSADKSLGSIGDIRQSIVRKEQKISTLQEQNNQLAQKLSQVIQKVREYEQIIHKQKDLIEHFESLVEQANEHFGVV